MNFTSLESTPRACNHFFCGTAHGLACSVRSGQPDLIPMNEIALAVPSLAPSQSERGTSGASKPDKDWTILMTGGRLQITADVDLEGIKTLKAVLDKYEEVPKLMN